MPKNKAKQLQCSAPKESYPLFLYVVIDPEDDDGEIAAFRTKEEAMHEIRNLMEEEDGNDNDLECIFGTYSLVGLKRHKKETRYVEEEI